MNELGEGMRRNLEILADPGRPHITLPQADPNSPLGVLDATLGRPGWYDERIPLQERVADAAQTFTLSGARSGQSFDQFQTNIRQHFPGQQLNFDSMRRPYEQQTNLEGARRRFQDYHETPLGWINRRAWGFLSPILTTMEDQQYADAQRRFEQGNPGEGDYDVIARYERRQQRNQEMGFGGQALSALTSVPAMLTEGMVAGRVVGLGGRLLAGSRAAGLLGQSQALRHAAQVASNTVLMPTMYLPEAAHHAVENHGQWHEFRNLAPALAVGALNVGILGSLTQGGGGLRGYLGRVATGVGEQQIADIASGALGLKTDYGVLGQVLNDRFQDAFTHAGVQALTFAAFGAMHQLEGSAVMDRWRDAANNLYRRGFSRRAAGETMARAVEPVVRDAAEGRQVNRTAELQAGGLRDYVETVQELMQGGAGAARERQREGQPTVRVEPHVPPEAEVSAALNEPRLPGHEATGMTPEQAQRAAADFLARSPTVTTPTEVTEGLKRLAASVGVNPKGKTRADVIERIRRYRKERTDADVAEAEGQPRPPEAPRTAPEPQPAQKPAEVAPTPPAPIGAAPKAPVLPEDPTGLRDMGRGMASSIGENLRSQLYESYKKGSVKMAGNPESVLQVAKAVGPWLSKEQFYQLLEEYASVSGKAGANRGKALAELAARWKNLELSPFGTRKNLQLPTLNVGDVTAVTDVDGLGAYKKEHGEAKARAIVQAKADALKKAGLEPYHDGQAESDEFNVRPRDGERLTTQQMNERLEVARNLFRQATGMDFSYGVAEHPATADNAMRDAKQAKKTKAAQAVEPATLPATGQPEVQKPAEPVRAGGAPLPQTEVISRVLRGRKEYSADGGQTWHVSEALARMFGKVSGAEARALYDSVAGMVEAGNAKEALAAVDALVDRLKPMTPKEVRQVAKEFGLNALSGGKDALIEKLEKTIKGRIGVAAKGETIKAAAQPGETPEPAKPAVEPAAQEQPVSKGKITATELKEILESGEVIPGLDARDMQVLRQLIIEGKTGPEVGELVGVSRERVRQLKDQALQLLSEIVEEPGKRQVVDSETVIPELPGQKEGDLLPPRSDRDNATHLKRGSDAIEAVEEKLIEAIANGDTEAIGRLTTALGRVSDYAESGDSAKAQSAARKALGLPRGTRVKPTGAEGRRREPGAKVEGGAAPVGAGAEPAEAATPSTGPAEVALLPGESALAYTRRRKALKEAAAREQPQPVTPKEVEESRQALERYGFSRSDILQMEGEVRNQRDIDSVTSNLERGTDEANPEILNEAAMMDKHLNLVLKARGAFPKAPTTPAAPLGVDPGRVGSIPGRGTGQPNLLYQQALANAKVAQERSYLDLERLASAGVIPNEATKNAAFARLQADPQAGEKLVAELARNMRPVDAVENALLLHRLVALDNQYRAGKEFRNVLDSRERNAGSPEEKREVQDQRDRHEAEMQAILGQVDEAHRVIKATGTEGARSLQFRRQMMAEDYSLTSMLQSARQARGRELSEAERKQIEELHDKIKELQDKLDGMEDRGEVQPGGPSETGFRLRQAKEKYDAHIEDWKRANAPWHVKAWRYAKEAIDIPISIMTSIDFPLLRQGLIGVVTRPGKVPEWVRQMAKSAFSEEASQRVLYDIYTRENAQNGLYKKGGVDFTGGLKGPREEGFLSNLVHKVPGLGQVLRGSERSYQTLLNLIRADVFDSLAASLAQGGKITNAEAKVIGNYVNVMSGRGPLGQAEKAATLLNGVFFAPKWAVSRFQYLLGQPLYSNFSEPASRARKLVLQEYGKFLGGVGLAMGLAALAGFNQEPDPRSAAFGKLKVGNTSIDMTGGLASALRFLSQTATLHTKNRAGQVLPISGQLPHGMDNYADVAARFVRGKLAPAPGTALNLLTGTDLVGKPVTPGSAAAGLVTPLFARDVVEAMTDLGIPKGLAVSLLGLLGAGMSTIDPNAPRPQPTPQEQQRQREINRLRQQGRTRPLGSRT